MKFNYNLRLPAFLFAFWISIGVLAQTDSVKIITPIISDTIPTVIKKRHSAHQATVYSAVLPGLGQIYNKQAWKVPILYAGLGTITGVIISTNRRYKFYVNQLNLINNYPELFDSQNIANQKQRTLNGIDLFRRYRDLNIILGCLAYAINILDANVAGHLKGFETTDDLSMKIKPALIPAGGFVPAVGISFQVTLR